MKKTIIKKDNNVKKNKHIWIYSLIGIVIIGIICVLFIIPKTTDAIDETSTDVGNDNIVNNTDTNNDVSNNPISDNPTNNNPTNVNVDNNSPTNPVVNENPNPSSNYDASIPCGKYQTIISSALSSLNPNECNKIDDKVCKDSCFSSYALAALDENYCKYSLNPLSSNDVSGIESCYVYIAEMKKNKSVCDEVNFNQEGYGYLGYKTGTIFYSCFGIRSGDVNGPVTYSNTFCAETNPITNCYVRSTGYNLGQNYKACDNLSVQDDLKDICYIHFVISDSTNPNFKKTLPFNCSEMKTNDGKTFCEQLSKDVTKLRNRGIGTEEDRNFI